jgi:hypothetical protein
MTNNSPTVLNYKNHWSSSIHRLCPLELPEPLATASPTQKCPVQQTQNSLDIALLEFPDKQQASHIA